jgi:hypothetical protein
MTVERLMKYINSRLCNALNTKLGPRAEVGV